MPRPLLCALIAALLSPSLFAADAPPAKRPNIVWIVAEDMSPDIRCYGDERAVTPNLDRLASQGARFTRCFTHAPVCAPSRSGLITGRYPTTLGSHHMRSKLIQPPRTFTQDLQQAGYFTAWPGKTDFNFDPPPGWVNSTKDWTRDLSELKARQPFFAYVNIGLTHESQTRATPEKHAQNTRMLTPDQRQDPAKLKLPPFYPDTPEVRNDLKQYYETVTAMDHRVGQVLAAIDRAGLADNTLILFFGDHGRGMPRYKRWCYDTGLHVALIARWPTVIPAGSIRDDLVAFIDLAPTTLTLAGAPIPKDMQGGPFFTATGGKPAESRPYVFAARDRMDETYDRIRSVRDTRYRYIRNFHPDLPYAQQINYNEENPTMQSWRKAFKAGALSPSGQAFFARTKPPEELYDTASDPYEITNLANSNDPAHQAKLHELRSALDNWIKQTNDLGAVPETELIQRGLVKDLLTTEYEKRKQQHKPDF